MRRQTRPLRTDLPERLLQAFARLDPKTEIPNWPRCVRLGIDYSVHAAGFNPENDADADATAYTCFVLGNLQRRDPPGDPPARCDAYNRAEKTGPDYLRAYSLLMAIRDATDAWASRGQPNAPALPNATLRILQRAARGERVGDAAKLGLVLDAAEQLSARLSPLSSLAAPGARF